MAVDPAALMAKRLNDERALIFSNLLNGQEPWKVAEQFHKSLPDVMNIFNFVLRKIRSRRLERMEPPITGSSIEEIRKQRIACLTILPKLNLDKDPRFKDVRHEAVELKSNGSIRNEDFLRQLKPLPENQRIAPCLKA